VEIAALLKTLKAAGEEWATPVKIGEFWDRPAVPFHAVFQCSESESQEVREKLAAVAASVEDDGFYSTDR